MLEFQLFRVKVYAPNQQSLFAAEFNPPLVLVDAIRRKPTVERKKGYAWHIGNVSAMDAFGMYFAVGRTTRSTRTLYDESTGNFVETETETAPYTHVLCDISLEVCGIARNYQLAPTVPGIARQLEKLLNSTVTASTGYRFEVSVISDPSEFLDQLREAYAVKRFSITFSLPNAWDVNEHFQRPFEQLVKEADAREGKAQITGSELNPDVVEDLARSAAATGNQAEARLQLTEKAKPVTRRLRGNIAGLKEEKVETDEDRRNVLADIRNLYGKIRGNARK